MWNVLVLVVMISLTTYYAMSDTDNVRVWEEARSEQLADSMYFYRLGAIRYFTDHPSMQTVDAGTLKAGGYLPEWSQLNNQPETSIWASYMNSAGRIYVYAASVPPPDVISHVMDLSHNTVLAGVFRTGDTTLYSPVYGDTNIPLPAPSEVLIPNGSPVWVAMRD